MHLPFTPPEIIVYGTVCLDRFLRAGENEENAIEMPGGEAFNTATALAGWGTRVLLTGTSIGDEDAGQRLRVLLDTSPLGLSRDFIPNLPDATTPVCTIRVAPDGERSMRGLGFRKAIPPPSLPNAVFSARPVFVTDPNLGEAAIQQCLAARQKGCPILAMDFDHVPAVVACSRILVTSREVLARHKTGETPEEAVGRLQAAGAQTAIVTLGVDGCVVADRDNGFFYSSALVPPGNVVDTTGAGDTFRAGLAYGLQQHWAFDKMLRFAQAAAALHCTVWGGGSRSALSAVFSCAKLS